MTNTIPTTSLTTLAADIVSRGKDGQSVPVGVGMPTIKLDRMAGGTGR
ncbi:MAG TPA: hypothetical protein VFW25_08170 [Silvibacterium sp.]|nr:hypothetical protein [Silvibacterium sp.]